MNELLQKTKRFIDRNSTTILTCVGSAGVIATAVLSAKATPKALQIIEQAKEEKGEDLTKTEIVKVAAPVYIPAVLVGASTIACIVSAQVLNKRKQAALTSAYALLDSSYKEYKKKVKELYGEKADENVRKELAKDEYEKQEVKVSENPGMQLFYDEYSGRYFESTLENVLRAEYTINRVVAVDYGAYLNEFYDLLGIETVEYGDHIGWSIGYLSDSYWVSWVEFEHTKVTLDDGLECTIISIFTEPVPDFDEY